MPTRSVPRPDRSFCLAAALLLAAGCATRDAWQQPETVIETLAIAPGATVADVGAGDGYFVPWLSRAVGPEGRVFAVEVDAERVVDLEQLVADEGLDNVEVVLGGFEDPGLPDGEIDLVFLCNTYHHIEARPAYFARVRTDDLTRGGRVAILDPNRDATGMVSWFLEDGHTSSAPEVREEMAQAGYESTASPDFLVSQIFEIFAPQAP